MKQFAWLCCMLYAFGVSSQDTLVYKNGTRAAVVLKEITPHEIRFQKPELADGPDYVISKATVDRIIYRNGSVEVVQPVSIPVVQPSVAVTVPAGTIAYRGNINYYDSKKSYRTLRGLSQVHPDLNRHPQLLKTALSIKQYKGGQDGTRTGAIVCGGLAIGGAFLYTLASAFGGGNEPAFIVPPIALAGLAVILTTVSVTFNLKLKQERMAFVKQYND